MNRDTLYSAGVFDLDAGPVTITMPNAGKRYMALQIINEDEYTQAVLYGPGSHTFDKNKIGTRYMIAAIRTLVDPNNPKDMEEVHALQDAVKGPPEKRRHLRNPEVGSGQPEESA